MRMDRSATKGKAAAPGTGVRGGLPSPGVFQTYAVWGQLATHVVRSARRGWGLACCALS